MKFSKKIYEIYIKNDGLYPPRITENSKYKVEPTCNISISSVNCTHHSRIALLHPPFTWF